MTSPREVVRPRTLSDVVQALSSAGPTARVHGGGTDLMVQINEKRGDCQTIVDLGLVEELRGIETTSGSLRIGAAEPMSDILGDSRIRSLFPALIDAMQVVGSVQIRHRATLGGNIGNASPAADTVPVLVALDAAAVIAGPTGFRTVPVDSLFLGPGRTTVGLGEVIKDLHVPTTPTSSSAYLRLTRRNSVDLALVSVAVVLPSKGTPRVSFGAAGPVIARAKAVEEALADWWANGSDSLLEEAARIAEKSVRPISDLRAGEGYRRAMAGVLLKRAARIAYDRADGGSTG